MTMCKYPLPNRTVAALAAYKHSSESAHPGLRMDMFAVYPDDTFATFDQENGQKPHLVKIVEAAAAFKDTGNKMLERWENGIADGADTWELTTIWRLAAHLSRSTAMENAALCMHPVYGFPYLPGSGLKGVARAYAELEGVARAFAELEGYADSDEFARIFGTTACVGQIVFLEAWPKAWPELQVDILNNHHTEYYTNKGEKEEQKKRVAVPPGDWESPIPVYFLTVAPQTTFRFALRKAHAGVCDDDLQTAREWLNGGLAQLGFGAKTAAGYGYFQDPATSPEAIALNEKKAEFVAWTKQCANSNNIPKTVHDSLIVKLRELPDTLHDWAKETLLEALNDYRELYKKGKRGKPSIAEWITSCQPKQ